MSLSSDQALACPRKECMHAHLVNQPPSTQLAVQSRSEAHCTLSVLGVVLSRSWPLFTAPDNPLARGAPPSQHREALRGMMVAFQHLAPKVDPALLGTLHHLQQHPDGGVEVLGELANSSGDVSNLLVRCV